MRSSRPNRLQICVALGEDEEALSIREAIDTASRASGMSLSEWVREAIAEKLKKAPLVLEGTIEIHQLKELFTAPIVPLGNGRYGIRLR